MLLVSEEVKKDLEARVDIAEAQAKLAKDTLAKTQAEVEQKITAGKDELIDLVMYSFRVANQNADISFLEDEAEGLLAKWKARLKEERELQSVTTSEAVADHNDIGGEVTSQAAEQTETSAEMSINQRPIEDTPAVEDAPEP